MILRPIAVIVCRLKPFPAEKGGGMIAFISGRFDPVAALSATYSQVCKVNIFVWNSLYLDNISRF